MITAPDPADDARRCDDPVVTDLVARARTGDRQAWDALVERYAPLIWSICRRYGLGGADAEDAGQNVWLKLVGQLGSIRESAALPGWLATTTRRECARILRAAPGPRDAGYLRDAGTAPDDHAEAADQLLLEAERHAALRQALADLPPLLPAADRPAHQRPSPYLCRDQCQAGHPGRQHRAQPRPLPGQTAPPPGHYRADQRRRQRRRRMSDSDF
jgi:RNA polymerase sigma factor (sigma-70 family)